MFLRFTEAAVHILNYAIYTLLSALGTKVFYHKYIIL